MEEFSLRGIEPTDEQIQNFRLPNHHWSALQKADDAFRALDLTPGQYLLKYSRGEFVKAALYRGEIRISPASAYDDPSLNYSIKDDELSIRLRLRETLAINQPHIGTPQVCNKSE
jgi:hypothetical protein